MEELVAVVTQKTGLSPEQARAATQAVLDFLMTKVPGPLAEQIKLTLSGGSVTDAVKGVSGLFGQQT